MEPLITLGLWGDGDEIHAIEDAFRAIGVKLPVEDAPGWVTVGDLWNSIARIAPDVAKNSGNWDNFRRAISEETAVDWKRVNAETALLDGRGGGAVIRLFRRIRDRVRGSVA